MLCLCVDSTHKLVDFMRTLFGTHVSNLIVVHLMSRIHTHRIDEFMRVYSRHVLHLKSYVSLILRIHSSILCVCIRYTPIATCLESRGCFHSDNCPCTNNHVCNQSMFCRHSGWKGVKVTFGNSSCHVFHSIVVWSPMWFSSHMLPMSFHIPDSVRGSQPILV